MTYVTTMSKQNRLDVRVTDQIKAEFQKVAEYRGLTTSAMLHSFIVKTIYETKKEAPEIFSQLDEPNALTGAPVKTLEEAIADDEKKKREIKKPSQ